MKKIRYLLEYSSARLLFTLFSVLPYHIASDLGGMLARMFFTHTKRTLIAKNNITLALPDTSTDEANKIIAEMWENIGRNFAELPHISTLTDDEIWNIASITGKEHICPVGNSKQGALFFTAHIGNWEIAPRVFSALGSPVNIVYRQANNPGIEKMIQKARSTYVVNTLPKGPGGSRAVLEQLKKGNRIGMLVDQKMNDGIRTIFFGQQAMTAPAIARLAIKYHIPIIPVRVNRYNKSHFKVTVYPQLELPDTNDRENDIFDIINNVNQILESWITEAPGQWIWMHNRWS